jgi:hypothetical protein
MGGWSAGCEYGLKLRDDEEVRTWKSHLYSTHTTCSGLTYENSRPCSRDTSFYVVPVSTDLERSVSHRICMQVAVVQGMSEGRGVMPEATPCLF